MSKKVAKVIAVIAARGGSKRLPKKNICLFLGKPMLQWVVEACQYSSRIDDVIVTSEDEEILDLARTLGCRIVVRPLELTGDEVPKIEAVRHAVTVFEEEQRMELDVVVMLGANSPELRPGDLDRAIDKLESHNLWEIISFNDNLIQDGAFRIYRRGSFFNPFSAHTGAILTNYIDIHTTDDLQVVEARYGTVERFLETRR